MFKTLKNKLLAVFLIFSSLCVLIIILRSYVSSKKDKIGTAQHLLHSINESNLRKFNAVADFFTLETRNIKFFQTGKSPLLSKIDSLNKSICNQVRTINDIDEIKKLNLNSTLSDISKKIYEHVSLFDEILDLVKKRGYADYGYIGLMRSYSHKLESCSKINLTLILSLRRTEKDYMLRNEDRYIDLLKAQASELNKDLTSHLTLSKIEKDSCCFYLKNYVAYFDTMAFMTKKIGLKDNSAMYLKLNQTEESIETEFSKLIDIEYHKQKDLYDNLNYSFLGFSALLVIISIFLSYYLSKRITKPITSLAQTCQSFVESGFEKVDKSEIVTHDKELKKLINNFKTLKTEIVGLLFDFKQKVKERTLTIEQQNNELLELNATKDKFFSIIAHDLRSPFAAILGFSEMLVNNIEIYDKEKIKQYTIQIKDSADHTFKLLENLLDWAKLQRGLITPDIQKYNLRIVSDEICMVSQDIARSKNITIQNNIKTDIFSICDVDMTKTAIRNLISNAIKFTKSEGVISIFARQKENFVEIQIQDTGVGIPAEKIPKLFKIEKNISTTGTADEQGSGLGLLLCKELIEKQGGKIWLESEVNKGTSFYFTILN